MGVSRDVEANPPRMSARMGLRLAPGILLGLELILASCTPLGGERADRGSAPTPDPFQILADLRAELIPAGGSLTTYGPPFSSEGFEILREWNEGIRPEPEWADDYTRLDIRLPCCEAIHPNRDETQNCGCGHHQALYGLAKGLLRSGFRVPNTQAEIGRWRAFLFPRETLQAEMERRAVEDPALRDALDELQQQGVC